MGCGASTTKVRYVVPRVEEESGTTDPPRHAGSYRKAKESEAPAPVPNFEANAAKSPTAKSPTSGMPAAGRAPGTVQDLCWTQTSGLAGPWPTEEEGASPTVRPGTSGAAAEPAAPDEPSEDRWGEHAEWIDQRAADVLAAYNFFFEHIGIRKGWRTAPFEKEEVQVPFQAAAEVVTVVRAKLDERAGGGMVLRQLEGSAMNFLWGWSPERPPGSSREVLEEFFRGLVFATLSDGQGLVEGLDAATIEYYVSCHPLMAAPATCAGAPEAGVAAVVAAMAVSGSGASDGDASGPGGPGPGASGLGANELGRTGWSGSLAAPGATLS